MKPTVGRIVHYYLHEGDVASLKPLAAIIVCADHYDEDIVNLKVLGPSRFGKPDFHRDNAQRSDAPQVNRWMWPPRV